MARRSSTPVSVGEEDSNSDEELPEEGKNEMYRSTGVENVVTPLHPSQLLVKLGLRLLVPEKRWLLTADTLYPHPISFIYDTLRSVGP